MNRCRWLACSIYAALVDPLWFEGHDAWTPSQIAFLRRYGAIVPTTMPTWPMNGCGFPARRIVG